MRVLMVSNAGGGHLRPLLPLARALVEAGHQVAVVTPRDFCSRVARAGLEAIAGGLEAPRAKVFLGELPRFVIDDVEARTIAYFVAVHAPAMAEDLVEIARRWQPDVLVHEEGEFATPVIATVLGLPYACQSWGPMRPLAVLRREAEAMGPLWERWGHEPGELGGLVRYLYLDLCPAQVQHPDIASITTARPVRPTVAGGRAAAPAWLDELGPGPNVYVRLGNQPLFNLTRGAVRALLEGLAGQAAEVVVDAGRGEDPLGRGPRPPNVRVERFVPESALLPHCDLVVSNASAASVLAALSHGLPLLTLPRGSASQDRNAEAVVRGGAGLRLRPDQVTATEIERCVRALLVEPGYRERAANAERQVASMPPAAQAVRMLDRLARDRRPLASPRRG